MKIDQELISKILKGEAIPSKEESPSNSESLLTSTVMAYEKLVEGISRCIGVNDLDGAKMLLSTISQESVEEAPSVNVEDNTEVTVEAETEEAVMLSAEEQEESKVELSAIQSFANSIESDLNEIDTEVAAIKDRDISRKVGAKLQVLFDKVLNVKSKE